MLGAMPRNKAIDSSASSDDDSISLTSTAPSEPKDEYPIEGILAERVDDGTTMYLVKWVGYPDERCTWEPASSFQDEQTFHDWQNQKMRISRSLELPYNVSALETRVEHWLEAAAKRKARRRAKKIRLGLPVNPEIEGDNSDYTSSEALEEEDDNEPDRPWKKRRGSSTSVTRGKDNHDGGVPGSSKPESQIRGSRKWTAKEEAALKSGLELVKGPFWHKILGYFGPTGTTSKDLKDRDVVDLEAKTLKLKIDYLKCGRDVPQYLRYANDEIKDSVPGYVESTDRKNEDHDSSLDKDFLMEEVKQTTAKRSQQPTETPSELLSDVQQSKPSEQQSKGLNPSNKSQKDARNCSAVLKPKMSIAQMIPRVKPAEKIISNRKDSQMGRVGTGPLRMGLGDRKLKSAGKKPKVSGAAILGNWNASVRPRGKQLPLQNATDTVDKPPEKFAKLSIKRRYEKAGRNERAPDFDSLTLRNPKEFHVIKKPSISSPVTKEPTKTPFESYRENLAEGVEEPSLVKASTSTSTFNAVESPSDALDQEEQNLELADWATRNIGTTATSALRFPAPRIPAPEFLTPVFPTPGLPASVLSTPDFLGSQFPAPSASYGPQRPQFVGYNAYDPYQVIGTIKLGPNRIDQGAVRFRGSELPAKRLLIGIKSAPRELFVWFKHSIVAEDYKAYFHTVRERPIPPIASALTKIPAYKEPAAYSGYLAPFPQAEENISKMAEALRVHVSGGLFMANKFILLIYPSGSEDWTFLDDRLPICPPEAVLRFVMRTPIPGLTEETRKPILESAEQESQKPLPGLTEDESQMPLPILTEELPFVSIRDGESNINAVFRNMYNVEYSRLAAPTTSAKTTEMYNFFLIFPPSKETERHLVVEFLRHNKASEISSYETKGAWDYFSTRINAGVIIVSHCCSLPTSKGC